MSLVFRNRIAILILLAILIAIVVTFLSLRAVGHVSPSSIAEVPWLGN